MRVSHEAASKNSRVSAPVRLLTIAASDDREPEPQPIGNPLNADDAQDPDA
jgi:hypothetical protein